MTARRVSALLRRGGIPVGYRYSQTGYRDRSGRPISEPGVLVSAMRRDHLSRTEVPDDHVSVYPLAPEDLPGTERARLEAVLLARICELLRAAGVAHSRRGAYVRVPFEAPAPAPAPLVVEGLEYRLHDQVAAEVLSADTGEVAGVSEVELFLASALEDLASELLARFPSVVAHASRIQEPRS